MPADDETVNGWLDSIRSFVRDDLPPDVSLEDVFFSIEHKSSGAIGPYQELTIQVRTERE